MGGRERRLLGRAGIGFRWRSKVRRTEGPSKINAESKKTTSVETGTGNSSRDQRPGRKTRSGTSRRRKKHPPTLTGSWGTQGIPGDRLSWQHYKILPRQVGVFHMIKPPSTVE